MTAQHTKEPWVAGYGNGVTGPKTPSAHGPTCEDSIRQDRDAEPEPYFTIISKGKETVAIIPGEVGEREATRDRIVACVNACEGINPEAVPDLLANLFDIANIAVGSQSAGTKLDKIRTWAEAAIAKAKPRAEAQECPECHGSGVYEPDHATSAGPVFPTPEEPCDACGGTGEVAAAAIAARKKT